MKSGIIILNQVCKVDFIAVFQNLSSERTFDLSLIYRFLSVYEPFGMFSNKQIRYALSTKTNDI